MNNKKILVVDDESCIREVLERFLTRKGYTVITAENGVQAIASFINEKPDLVLLDIIMPGLGGTEVLKKIKEIDPNARVVVITAVKDNELGKFVLNQSGTDYVTKPIDFNYIENNVLVNTA